METYDPEMAARVWQRVRAPGGAAPEWETLPALIAGEWSVAMACQQLARGRNSRTAGILHRLSQEAQEHAACLRGIYVLCAGEKPVIRTPRPEEKQPEALLRRCYQLAFQAQAEYERRAADPQYGPVYARLAQQKREHCQQLLALLGETAGA